MDVPEYVWMFIFKEVGTKRSIRFKELIMKKQLD